MRKAFLMVAGVALWMVSSVAVQAADAVVAKPEFWANDFAAAKAQAAKEGKDILVDFTGSDWCGWCIKLKSEVFDTPEFQAAAPKDFVLVELDFPRNKSKMSKELLAQNKQLGESYGVRGYPTILLMDAAGVPYSKFGYQAGGGAKYMETLKSLQAIKPKRDAAWKKAETATGIEKAKLLAEGLAAMDEREMFRFYSQKYNEVAALDPQDVTGVGYKKRLFDFMNAFEGLSYRPKDYPAAAKMADDFIEKNNCTGERKQEVMLMKMRLYPPVASNALERVAKSLQDVNTVSKLVDEVVAVDPASETGKHMAEVQLRIEEFRKRVAELAKKPSAPAPATP